MSHRPFINNLNILKLFVNIQAIWLLEVVDIGQHIH